MNKPFWALAVLSIAMVATGLHAQDTPNFSGRWTLNVSKSDFGPVPPPDSASYLIRHNGATLSLDYSQEGKTTHVEFTTDGQERVTESTNDAEIVTRVYWAGPVLTFEARQKARPAHQAEAMHWTSRWQMAPDKKQFAIQRHFVMDNGEFDQKLVYDRQ